MKVFRILGRNISDSFKGVFRNFSLSLASISCITITLILVGFSIILSYNVNRFTKDIEEDVTIVVFLNRGVTEEQINVVKTQIEGISNVESISYKSKEMVKTQMQKDSEVFNSIMSQYTPETNPLQDTYLVKVKDIKEIGNTSKVIKGFENVSLVKYGEGSVEELVKIFDIVKKLTYIIVAALIIVTAFLISNTIKITIQTRKKEIEIMRLVGASNLYIKQPFFFEGIFLGFLGAIIPIVSICYGYNFLYEKLNGQLFTAIIQLVRPSSLLYITSVILLGVGVVVGAFGSYRAVRKYLKI